MSDNKVVKIGIMSFAHMHAHAYASCLKKIPAVEFVGIADDDQARAEEMAELYGVKAFATYEEMLASDIDAVIVASENANHRRHVVMAAQSEKHALCEKPLASTKQDAEAIVEVCKRSGVKLMTAFPCRFHPAFKRLKESVLEGRLGKLLAMKGTNQGQCPGGWFLDKNLSGGGAVIDHTVHLVDLMRVLTKAEPARIYAEIDNRMFGGDYDDTGIISIDFTNNVFATIDSSWSRPKSYPFWGNVNLEVIGTQGVAKMEMFAQKIDVFSDRTGKHTYEYWGDDINQAMIESFVDSIAHDKPVEVTGEDGVKALEVAVVAYESASRREVIDLYA
ncbi:MAG: Gfo/Idh/MocA family oxidoreductase [Armatimonadetes bacterium]|nr:Gfo/Idh/MocA family oxidoreductase [Armatimonadota bacterium]